jgi:hypothetical protein
MWKEVPMNIRNSKKLVYLLLALLVLPSFLVACGGGGVTPEDPGNGGDVGPSPSPSVEVIPSDQPAEKKELATRQIEIDNCMGTGEKSYNIEESQTINYTLDMGTNISVNASGSAQIPQFGQIEVGAAVSRQYGVGYGNSITARRGHTERVAIGTAETLAYRIIEYWETGTVRISNALSTETYPYNFRTGFDIEIVDTIPGECSNLPTATLPATPTPTFIQALSGTYQLQSWNETVSVTTLYVDVLEGTLTIDANGAADWVLTIEPKGMDLQLTPQIMCGGQVRLSSQQLEGVPGGERNGTKDVGGNIWPEHDLLFLTFCGWSLQYGADSFSLHLDVDGNGNTILEMKNSKGTFTWQK